MHAKIAIFGLGNPLMTDDGVGVHLLSALKQRGELPSNVELIDLGTGGMRLLHQIEGRRKLIFIDCALMGERAGALRRFRPDEARSRKAGIRRFGHEGDLLGTLDLARDLGTLPDEVVIFGIEPERIAPGLDLSPALAARLDEYAERVLGEAARTRPG